MNVKLSLYKKNDNSLKERVICMSSDELSVLREVGYLVYGGRTYTLQKNSTSVFIDEETEFKPIVQLVFMNFDAD